MPRAVIVFAVYGFNRNLEVSSVATIGALEIQKLAERFHRLSSLKAHELLVLIFNGNPFLAEFEPSQ